MTGWPLSSTRENSVSSPPMKAGDFRFELIIFNSDHQTEPGTVRCTHWTLEPMFYTMKDCTSQTKKKETMHKFFYHMQRTAILIPFLLNKGSLIMITSRDLVLFGILILSLIFLFRQYSFHLKRRPVVYVLYFPLLCLTSVFCYCIRIYVVSSNIGFFFSDVLTVFIEIGLVFSLPNGLEFYKIVPGSWKSASPRDMVRKVKVH